MPLAARLIVYDSTKKPLAGPVPVQDVEFSDLSGSQVHEFDHQVYTVQKDYFYALLYGVDFVRKHVPLRIVKPIDKLSIPLMGLMIKGTFLPQVEVRWYEFQKDTHKEVEYFRMTLEHVRLNSIHTCLPDAKDAAFEQYDHLESITFCYQKITWLYVKGHLVYTDIWNNGFYAEEDEKDFSPKKEEDAEEPQEAVMTDKLTLKFTSGVFEEPKDGFQFDKKATVKFTFEANRKPDYKENKVYAKLYAVYNGKTEDLSQINEGRLVAEDSWSTEFKLKKPKSYIDDANRKPDAAVEYYAEIENAAAGGSYKGASISIGSAIAMQSMSWKSEAARRDEKVTLAAEFKGCKDGEEVTIEIFEYDQDGDHDATDEITAKITNGKLDAEWTFVYEEDTDDILTDEEAKKTGGKYNPPEYFFTVRIGDQKWGDKQESGLLEFKDWIEVELQDENGAALANEPFELHLPDGSAQKGTLDDKGYARVDSVPPGPVEVVFTNYPSVTIKK
jgi:type VI secretion system secreted protein Hcp